MAQDKARIELWGGPECTICRIGDVWRDQARDTGHDVRLDDLDRIASLGIRTVRYPILWERIATHCSGALDFSWSDRQLARLRELGVDVIGGLVHHGSGPPGTDLLDPDFPTKLADFAARVAERYPWIDKWTPVNEPLTTARFSALYGHWYPHHRDFGSFALALVHQCLATARAMRAIRSFVPGAALIQTEDIGRTFGTFALRAQAKHDNLRSWLSLDLLFGRVDEKHPLFQRLRDAGVEQDMLAELAAGEGRPQLIGVNHYLTSDRFLDHRCELYAGEPVGGNGHQHYVDVEAVRVAHLAARVGIGQRLHEVWDRYHTPIAVTEVHHGCTQDEQLRWLMEVWETAQRAKDHGADVRAVTLWSMFGCVDWRSLVTRRDYHYEPGVFDARSNPPRPTILAKAAKALATEQRFDHPTLAAPGWWHRPDRFYGSRPVRTRPAPGDRPLLVTGATGTLGRALQQVAQTRGLRLALTDRAELNIEDPAGVRAAVDRYRPWAVINAAGYVRVADAEREPDRCMAANAGGAGTLATVLEDYDIPLVGISSDLVFDGRIGPYRESDPCSPNSVYGHSKCAADLAMLCANSSSLVVRTAAFFGPWDKYNFAWQTLQALRRGEQVEARADVVVTPTYVPDLCHALLNLVIDGERGTWHLTNHDSVSWYEFALRLAEQAAIQTDTLVATTGQAANTSLVSERGKLLRPLDAAIADYAASLPRQEHLIPN